MKKIIRLSILICSTVFILSDIGAQSINMRLKINQEETDTVFRNEPVVFSLTLTNQKAQSDARWNTASERGLNDLEEKKKKGELTEAQFNAAAAEIRKTMRTLGSITIGSPVDPWTSSVKFLITNTSNRNQPQWSLFLFANPPVKGEAKLDANGFYAASWGISSNDLQKIPPGTYAVEASVNNILSNAVLIHVQDSDQPPSISNSINSLLQWGQFYWQSGDAEKTILYADKILTLDPLSLDGLSLKGDGLILQRSYLPALEIFNKARAEYYKKNGAGAEPPGYLLSIISWLKHELGEPMR